MHRCGGGDDADDKLSQKGKSEVNNTDTDMMMM
jgi:hypothetical protein